MNPSIHKLILGKTEAEAKTLLREYKCPFRIFSRDGVREPLAPDRNDKRFNLVLENGRVIRAMPG